MGEFKGTPGPWVLCAHLRDNDACECGYRGVIFGPEPIGYAICQPGHEPAPEGQEGTEPPRYPREVEIANSHLIAAAPELLAALMKFTEDYVEMVNSGDCGFWEPENEDKVKAARAAIAKATGAA